MLPDIFYFSLRAWLGYVIYLPFAALALWMSYWLLRRIPIRIVRILSCVLLGLCLFTYPLWDALSLSYEAEKVCRDRGGMHIYKTVEVEGFISSNGIKYWSRYGFSYIENGAGENMGSESLVNGVVVREKITEHRGAYQLQTGIRLESISNRFFPSSSRVININSEEVLGELITMKIQPSWFDFLMRRFIPLESTPWRCGDDAPKGKGSYSPQENNYKYNLLHVIFSTLKPIKAGNK